MLAYSTRTGNQGRALYKLVKLTSNNPPQQRKHIQAAAHSFLELGSPPGSQAPGALGVQLIDNNADKGVLLTPERTTASQQRRYFIHAATLLTTCKPAGEGTDDRRGAASASRPIQQTEQFQHAADAADPSRHAAAVPCPEVLLSPWLHAARADMMRLQRLGRRRHY